jgi:hypothetical protein
LKVRLRKASAKWGPKAFCAQAGCQYIRSNSLRHDLKAFARTTLKGGKKNAKIGAGQDLGSHDGKGGEPW